MPNIVILDGKTIISNDLSWDGFDRLGRVTIYPRTKQDEAVARIGDADAVLTSKVFVDAALLDACPRLRYVGVLATGYNNIDVDAARSRGVTVTNIPAYSTAAVAQHIFALLLELTNQVGAHAQAVHTGQWHRTNDFCFWNTPLTELTGKTMTIVGFGQIGQAAARIALALGMSVVAVARRPEAAPAMEGVRLATLEDGLRAADVLALCCPLTEATTRLLRAETLALLRPSALVINTARGPLVDEADMAAALAAGTIGGYGADVISKEPMQAGHPLQNAPHCILTPHIAWAAYETRVRLIQIAIENLEQYLAGKPQNVIC